MYLKNLLRKKYYILRKKNYYEISFVFFHPLISFLKSNFKKKKFNLALYYPSNFEINVLKILEHRYINNQNILLPVVERANQMEFFSWKKNNVLLVNKFGLLEPYKNNKKNPDLLIVPILAFDNNKYRLGYGKGYYDRYLNKYLKKFKNLLTVGVAFSFQKYRKLPKDKNDVKLDYILTEKGIF